MCEHNAKWNRNSYKFGGCENPYFDTFKYYRIFHGGSEEPSAPPPPSPPPPVDKVFTVSARPPLKLSVERLPRPLRLAGRQTDR